MNRINLDSLNRTNKRNPINSSYKLNDQILHQVTKAKYLGVTINQSLSWHTHINICNKANKSPYVNKLPHVKADTSRIEIVQCKSARFVFNDFSSYSSVSFMLTKLNQSLEQRITNTIIMFYKITNNLISINFFQHIHPITSCKRGYLNRFISPPARLNYYYYSFLPHSIRMWNLLPIDLVSIIRYSLKAMSHSSARLSHEYTQICYLPFQVIKSAAQKFLHSRFRMKIFIKVYHFTKNTTLQSVISY